MLFNSFDFLLFFPLVAVLYFLLPQKIKWMWLLACSVYFYMCWKAAYIVLIGFSIVVTYAGSLIITHFKQKETSKAVLYSKAVLTAVILSNLGVLALFKYYNFFVESVSALTGGQAALPFFAFALPVGISFYTFQALGYSIDVYRGTLTAERNIFRYALFVCFFPQLVAGPIERATNLLPQFYAQHRFDYTRVKKGLLLMGWGFFQKLVIADRLSIFVNAAYSESATADGSILLVATAAFAFQIYCDFASYSNIAIGAARVLGFQLMQNFNAPYLATSISDFWSRWHISLSTWFKDYLYIPLGGNRRGFWRKCFNLMVIFFVSGIWHGANYTFLIWGLLHGIYRVGEELLHRFVSPHLPANPSPFAKGLQFTAKLLATNSLVWFAWIFFRAASLTQASQIITRIATSTHFSALPALITAYGLDTQELWVAAVALLVLFAVDLLPKNKLYAKLAAYPLVCRWGFYLAGIVIIVIFGTYGPVYSAAPFIYFQF